MQTKLTLVERTILANQYRILSKFDNGESYSIKAEILENGYTGRYYEVLLDDEETSPEVCKETSDILQMYRVIDNTVATLSDDEKKSLDLEKIAFVGFDGHDSHYHYASFLIDSLDLWDEHKGTYIDSHSSSTLPKYQRIMKIYKERYKSSNHNLTLDDLKYIIENV